MKKSPCINIAEICFRYTDNFPTTSVSRILFWGSVSGAGTLRPAKSAKCMKKEGNCLSRRRVLPSFFMHLADFAGLRVPAPETEPQKRILLTRPLMKKSTKNRKNLLTTQISYAILYQNAAEDSRCRKA